MKPGSKIGRYRVVSQLGKGSMGSVFEVRHESIGQRAAIKVLNAVFAGNEEIEQRFFNEACAVNQVEHPGVVRISDVGWLEEGGMYLLMEYLDGENLRQRLDRNRDQGGLPLHEALDVTRQIASAVAAVHQRGIIHRDLKPANTFLVPDAEIALGRRVKVLDFGIAKICELSVSPAAREQRSRLTVRGLRMGSPRYMSPEQGRDAAEVTDRTDVYALGVMLYEMLSGPPPPFNRPLLAQVCPQVPARVAALVAQMLSPAPAERPEMAEIEERLRALFVEAGATDETVDETVLDPPTQTGVPMEAVLPLAAPTVLRATVTLPPVFAAHERTRMMVGPTHITAQNTAIIWLTTGWGRLVLLGLLAMLALGLGFVLGRVRARL